MSTNDIERIGVFFGSSTGNTKEALGLLPPELGAAPTQHGFSMN
ncbi:MAG: hypothetical protein KatS3mg053_2698 [Candidatus Roseilinea sp.]|nr:MAG: hypothetical protein KatS3mg053_2698 [Candidatus Roseilinea sp.]